jgi:hypothetical protein
MKVKPDTKDRFVIVMAGGRAGKFVKSLADAVKGI